MREFQEYYRDKIEIRALNELKPAQRREIVGTRIPNIQATLLHGLSPLGEILGSSDTPQSRNQFIDLLNDGVGDVDLGRLAQAGDNQIQLRKGDAKQEGTAKNLDRLQGLFTNASKEHPAHPNTALALSFFDAFLRRFKSQDLAMVIPSHLSGMVDATEFSRAGTLEDLDFKFANCLMELTRDGGSIQISGLDNQILSTWFWGHSREALTGTEYFNTHIDEIASLAVAYLIYFTGITLRDRTSDARVATRLTIDGNPLLSNEEIEKLKSFQQKLAEVNRALWVTSKDTLKGTLGEHFGEDASFLKLLNITELGEKGIF